jgi:hypothetical protein
VARDRRGKRRPAFQGLRIFRSPCSHRLRGERDRWLARTAVPVPPGSHRHTHVHSTRSSPPLASPGRAGQGSNEYIRRSRYIPSQFGAPDRRTGLSKARLLSPDQVDGNHRACFHRFDNVRDAQRITRVDNGVPMIRQEHPGRSRSALARSVGDGPQAWGWRRHRRVLGVLVLLLAPPAGHAGDRVPQHLGSAESRVLGVTPRRLGIIIACQVASAPAGIVRIVGSSLPVGSCRVGGICRYRNLLPWRK